MEKYSFCGLNLRDITSQRKLDLLEKGFELVSVTQTYENGTTLWFKGPATEEYINELKDRVRNERLREENIFKSHITHLT